MWFVAVVHGVTIFMKGRRFGHRARATFGHSWGNNAAPVEIHSTPSTTELDRLTMRCRTRRPVPSGNPLKPLVLAKHSLAFQKPFKSRKPMAIIIGAGIMRSCLSNFMA